MLVSRSVSDMTLSGYTQARTHVDDSPLFARREFDYCIIDEASQITLPACIGPLRFASRFILVGDHFQLPPLVKSQPARTGGLAISLFRRLAEAHPEAVFPLDEQYRMCDDIMSLANRTVYKGRLRCGNETVAKRSLRLTNPSSLECTHNRQRCWLNTVLQPRYGEYRIVYTLTDMHSSTKAIFISTSKLGSIAHDTRAGNLPQNTLEASLVLRLTQTLLRAGLSGKELALISPYRQQNKVLSAGIPELEEAGAGDVEVLTADRAQGRDYEAVVVSLVRANDEGSVGALLTDERRINVALTRARSKLVLVGCARTLRGSPILAAVLELMDQRGWIYELEPGDELLHDERAPKQEDAQVTPISEANAVHVTAAPSDMKATGSQVKTEASALSEIVPCLKEEEPVTVAEHEEPATEPVVKTENQEVVDLEFDMPPRSAIKTDEPDIIDVDADSDVEFVAASGGDVPVKTEALPMRPSGDVIDLSNY
jgi:DNA replication ATP-dependent helicase Dna2